MTRSFVASVDSKIVTRRSGILTWFETLSPQAQSELNVVKRKWHSGGYKGKQMKSVCRAVIEAAKERGWRVNGIQSVTAWLKKPL